MTAHLPNLAASMHQRLLNQSKARGIDFNLLLARFTVERFLYRLAQSAYADQFVLKGAMLLQV
ncbi:MAG: nucleotidyl transferase AbiEii/AbiGii toxin family protein, partial [Chloroflexi bacterium]|nr:nucleotidyl transferase AbiEii/AbiGii toxin family protein [Chloroflexota bacterium]